MILDSCKLGIRNMRVYRTILFTLFSALLVTDVVSGQGAHYTYPFSLECPESVALPGETISIKTQFEGGYTGERYSPTYNWNVSAGEITSGQGTSSISLRVPTVGDSNIIV